MGQQIVVYSGGSPDDAPVASAKWNADIGELYAGADVAGLAAAASVHGADLVDVLQSQGAVTFTASVGGATGGTLTAAIASGTYVFLFGDGETQVVTVTTGGTACSWPFALNSGSITTATAYLRKQSSLSQSNGFAAGTDPTKVGAVPQFVHVGQGISYSALSAAALTNSVLLFNLPAAGVIENTIIKHSASFTGGAISGYTLSVGNAASAAKYASAYNVFQAVGSSVYQLSANVGAEDRVSSTPIYLTATSVGANLNAATAGAVDVYVKMSVAL